ncbi:putative Spermine oxidase [Hypsibius exemplaris]|uniref:Spermine oxidase n=1 Tax=Hypsibius exemplaris TaxID=2072580 RepID=A0A1W0XDD3_HYPEX|nr:putative Spermine oxidase [Hypsibius exemplaris]
MKQSSLPHFKWTLLLLVKFCFCTTVQPNLDEGSAKIVIVGAGASGLAAAQRLYDAGFQAVTILEAEPRTGGRVHAQVIPGSGIVDLGGQFVHGKNTVLYNFAKDNDFLAPPITGRPEAPDFWLASLDGGVSLTAEDQRIINKEKGIFEEASEALNTVANDSTIDSLSSEAVRGPLFANALPAGVSRPWSEETYDVAIRSEMSWTGSPDPRLTSTRSFSDYKQEGGNFYLKPTVSMHDVLSAMTDTFPRSWLVHNRTVTKVEALRADGSSGPSRGVKLSVTSNDGAAAEVYEADHVIVTVSLGVLKSQPDLFNPVLSTKKLDAISKAGFGSITKLFLKFPSPFWTELGSGGNSGFGLIYPKPFLLTPTATETDPSIRGRPWHRYAFHFGPVDSANNTILLWVSGEGSIKVDELSDEQVINDILPVLQTFAGSVEVPQPESLTRERWSNKTNFEGTYSYFSLASARANLSPADLASPEWPFPNTYGNNGESIAHRLLFAGEATHSEYFSTIHGAILSGQREADRITRYYTKASTVTSATPTSSNAPIGTSATPTSSNAPIATVFSASLGGQPKMKRPSSRHFKWTVLLLTILFLCTAASPRNLDEPNAEIVIIGAGAAGLAAAQRLYDAGFRAVTVLEAEPRTGGRVHAQVIPGSGFVELGGQFAHGKNTVLYNFAKDNDFLAPPITGRPEAPDFWLTAINGGVKLTAEDQRIINKENEIFVKASDALSTVANDSTTHSLSSEAVRGPLFANAVPAGVPRPWFEETYDVAIRTEMSWTGSPDPRLTFTQSFSDYQQDGGDNYLKPTVSMHDVVSAMTATFPRSWLVHNRTVTTIEALRADGSSGPSRGVKLSVTSNDGAAPEVYEADYVIVTVSLGVLKSQPDLFKPVLPKKKLDAISKGGFGTITKLFLKFPSPFWKELGPEDAKWFGLIYPKPFLLTPTATENDSNIRNRPWHRYAFYFGPVDSANNTLLLWVAGEGSSKVDALSDDKVIKDIWPVLQTFAGSVNVPEPQTLIRSVHESA